MSDTKPWYRQLWPWLLMVPPLGAVCGGIATIILAVKTDDGLVSADYYKDGLAINQVLEKDSVAAAMGLSGDVRFNFDDGRLQVLLDAPLADEAALVLNLLHPTRDRLDQRVELRGAGIEYVGDVDPPTAGLWYVHLEPVDGRWRISVRVRIPGEQAARLQPNRI